MNLDKNIKINDENGIITFNGIEYIDFNSNYARFYNYFRLILNNKEFTEIEKQFFISFTSKFNEDDISYFSNENINEKELIKYIIYKRNILYGRVKDEEGNYFYISLGKKKTTKLENMIIDSGLDNNEKQDFLVSIVNMDKEQKKELKDILLEEQKLIKKYEKELIEENN
ncbi:MAG: hypothetical protein Q9M94_06040 [Candidatus Gracilibacteria bacterium]|nr:hypothetical protein [Candidatus Gracilibacteria bacterium]